MVHNETDVCVRRLHNYPSKIGVLGALTEMLLHYILSEDVLPILDVENQNCFFCMLSVKRMATATQRKIIFVQI